MPEEEELTIFDVLEVEPPPPVVAAPTTEAREADPPTSKAAGAAAELRFAQHRFETLLLYRGYGVTDDEAHLASAMFRPDGEPWHPGTTSKRRQRLAERGFIEPVVEITGRTITRATRTGEQAILWRLTSAGRTLLHQWEQAQHANE